MKDLSDFTAVGEYRVTCSNWWICSNSEYFPYLNQRQNSELWTTSDDWGNIKTNQTDCKARRDIGSAVLVSYWCCGGSRHWIGFIPKGFNTLYYGTSAILSVVVSWFMVSISIRKPIKMASRISPLEAVRFSVEQTTVYKRRKPSNSPHFQWELQISSVIAKKLSLLWPR